MPKKTTPRFGINYGWSLGEGPWNLDMDANLKLLDVILGGSITSDAMTAPPAAGSTWNTATASAGMVFSDANMTAATPGSGQKGAFGTPKLTGKVYFEYKYVAGSRSSNCGVGIAPLAADLTKQIGYSDTSTGSAGLQVGNTKLWLNNSGSTGYAFTALLAGDTLCIAYDSATRKVWFRINNGNWNNQASGHDPATGTGGYTINGTADLYPAWSSDQTETLTVNFGASAFAQAVPSGFSAVDAAVAANGSAYIVAAGATGAWAGKDGQVAALYDNAWFFVVPKKGLRVYVDNRGGFRWYNGAAWADEPGGSGGGIPDAPSDGKTYGRKDGDWAEVTGGGGGGIPDAPADGDPYVRKDNEWASAYDMVPNAHTYWRLSITKTDQTSNPYIHLLTLQLLSREGTDLTQTVGGTASAWNGGGSNAFDGDDATFWDSGSLGSGGWIKFAFTTPQDVRSLGILLRSTGNMLREFTFEYSDDDSAYTTLYTHVAADGDVPTGSLQTLVVNAGSGFVLDAPNNGKSYARKDGGWQEVSGYTSPAMISGLQMIWMGDQAIRIGTGSAYVPSIGRVVEVTTPIDVGSGGSASGWTHFYLYDNAGVAAVEVSTTAPAAPYFGTARTKTGDTSRRYIGSARRWNAWGDYLRFRHDVTSGLVAYLNNVIDNVLIAGGTATTPTDVDTTAYVPATSKMARCLSYNANSAGATAFFSNSEASPALSSSAYLAACWPNTYLQHDLLLDGAQKFNYMLLAAGTLYTRCQGYLYER